jgi:5-hydroxyisourate hydrolase-like protein (transthyretin family)
MKRLLLIPLLTCVVCALAVAQNPQVPANLVAQSPAEIPSRILLSWNATSSASTSFFRVYRSIGDTLAFQWIGVTQGNKFEDRSVTPGTLYYYFVTAAQFVDSSLRESGRSNVASVRAYTLPSVARSIITGKVTDQNTGQPIAKVRIRFYKVQLSTNKLLETTTDQLGLYTAPLDSGTYLIRAEELAVTVSAASHQPEWYENAEVPSAAKPVHAAAGDSVRVNFALAPSGNQPYAYLSGIVTDTNGTPLSGAAVALVRPIQELNAAGALTGATPGTGDEGRTIPGIGYGRGVVWLGYTNAQGKFFAQVLASRPYVAVAAKDGYLPEFFNNTTDPTQATILNVRTDTTGINFSLAPRPTSTGTLQGTVTDESGSQIPARIILFPRPKSNLEIPAIFVYSDSVGTFMLNTVPADTYTVLAVPYSEYASAYYKTSTTGTVSWVEADTVVVGTAPVTLNITLPRLQSDGLTRISGRVVNANQSPIAGVRISARLGNGHVAGYGLSDAGGHYSIDALSAGSVTLFADRFRFNVVQAPVTVPNAPYTVDNVDFILTGSFPTGVDDDASAPRNTKLFANYPNPFNPATIIRFDLAKGSDITLSVYDVLGREVTRLAQGPHTAGTYEVKFDAAGLSSGVYYYVLRGQGSSSFTNTGKMLLLR